VFLKSSRYYGLPTVAATGADGREATAVRLRVLPATQGQPRAVRGGDQLDMMAHELSGDGTRFWHIADANSELEANSLVARHGRVIAVPER
jgi:hypothetical protein